MISNATDAQFERRYRTAEQCIPRLLADRKYGKMVRAAGKAEELEALRQEWRERQARAERRRRARWIGHEAEWAES
jgi:hypothetical protein